MAELSLARDFPPADEAAWKALVEEALKGAPFASLRSKTYDGIDIEPLYARAARRAASKAAPPARPGRSCSGSTCPTLQPPTSRSSTI